MNCIVTCLAAYSFFVLVLILSFSLLLFEIVLDFFKVIILTKYIYEKVSKSII